MEKRRAAAQELHAPRPFVHCCLCRRRYGAPDSAVRLTPSTTPAPPQALPPPPPPPSRPAAPTAKSSSASILGPRRATATATPKATSTTWPSTAPLPARTVTVIQLYTGEGFDFHLPKAALRRKGLVGLSLHQRAPARPRSSPPRFKKSCQLWIISGTDRQPTDAHIKVIKDYFDSGARRLHLGRQRALLRRRQPRRRQGALLGAEMLGNLPGAQNQWAPAQGRAQRHLAESQALDRASSICSKAVTIATIQPNQTLQPLRLWLGGKPGHRVL